MSIAQIPEQVASTTKEAAQELKHRVHLGGTDKVLARSLAVGSLVAGAVLLARGKRKAGFVATAVGAVIAILEDPEEVSAVWNNIPSYIQSGNRLLSRFEGFVEDLSNQGQRFKSLLEKIERR